MKVKPIPSSLLTDSITLITPTAASVSEQLLTDVRVIRTSAVTNHLASRMRDISEIVVYYDCENSCPTGVEFCAGQSLAYCGELYEITEAILFAGEQPHHYRIKARKTSGAFRDI